MSWKFDPAADAAYLSISAGEVARTLFLAENVLLDVDADGRALGLEVLAVSTTDLGGIAAGSPAR